MKKETMIASLALVPSLSFGHADHAPKIAQCAAKDCAQGEIEAAVPAAIQKLVEAGKVDGAWTSAKVEKVEKKAFKKETEWVATVFDANAKDTAKQRLYVFITMKGYLNGSNFSGK